MQFYNYRKKHVIIFKNSYKEKQLKKKKLFNYSCKNNDLSSSTVFKNNKYFSCTYLQIIKNESFF